MLDALLAGLLAGLFVAVLVGSAAMTVMETAIQRGRRVALAAGGGIASGDALWAALAAGGGAALSRMLAPWERALQYLAVGALAVFLVFAVLQLRQSGAAASVVGLAVSPLRAYREFLVHALRHPATVFFFLSLIIGAPPRYGAGGAVAFVGGVFLASLTWQWALALAGARRGRLLSDRTRRVVLALDCVLLGLFIVYIAFGFHRSGL